MTTPDALKLAAAADELPMHSMPSLPSSLLDLIGNYGMARSECAVGGPEFIERYQALIKGIKDYAAKQQHAALESLRAKNAELERLCDETYVASGADAYHHACSEMERWQKERIDAGKDAGTEGSLCDGIAWLYGHIKQLEAQVESLRAGRAVPDVQREIAAALALFPADIAAHTFRVSGYQGPFEADDDTQFYSKKKVVSLLEKLHGHLTAAAAAATTPPQAEQAGKRASLTPEEIEEIAQKHSDSSAGPIGGLSDYHVFEHPSLQAFVAEVLYTHPAQQPDDARDARRIGGCVAMPTAK